MKYVFSHPSLRNRRGKKPVGLILVEDYTPVEKPKRERKANTGETAEAPAEVSEAPAATEAPTQEAAPTAQPEATPTASQEEDIPTSNGNDW